jgi:Ca-activated chloride channel family protein
VVYASEAYTKTPVTSDKGVVEAIKSIKYDNVLGWDWNRNGTA